MSAKGTSQNKKEKSVAFLKIAVMGIIFWILDISAAVSPAAFPVWWDLLKTISFCPHLGSLG